MKCTFSFDTDAENKHHEKQEWKICVGLRGPREASSVETGLEWPWPPTPNQGRGPCEVAPGGSAW